MPKLTSVLCCPLCEVETDTQKHLLSCESLSKEKEMVTRVLMKKFKMRKKGIKEIKGKELKKEKEQA